LFSTLITGGHLDKEDFQDVLSRDTDNSLEGPALLVAASRIAAVRELYEETGIDLRSKLERLKPVRLQVNSHESLFCQFKKRMFYKVILKDSDFCTTGSKPMGDSSPPLMLKLSEEHQGFRFVSNMSQAVLLLVEHSGGKVSKALEMAMSLEEIIPAEEQGKMEDEIL